VLRPQQRVQEQYRQFLWSGAPSLSLAWVKRFTRRVVPRPVRNWLRSPSTSLRWIWDSTKFSFGVTKKLQFTPSLALTLHPRVYQFAIQNQINDLEQRAEFESFVTHCHPGMLLFDVGASYGLFSLAAAKFDGKAVAVDPSPIAIRMMGRQLDMNQARQNIHLVKAAVSDVNGSLKMLSSGVFSEGYLRFVTGRSQRELTNVGAITIDKLASEFGNPTHIKIDVEGYEAAALRGGRETLTRFSPLLFLELHNQLVTADGRDPNEALDELQSLGYETLALDGSLLDKSAILRASIIRVMAKRSASAIGHDLRADQN
jgi:FkbM family methyltransferase